MQYAGMAMSHPGSGSGLQNGKQLMVAISEEGRSISPSPQPGLGGYSMPNSGPLIGASSMGSAGPGSGNGADSPYMHEESSGEGETSQFGRAKKSKRKAAPRTSRACRKLVLVTSSRYSSVMAAHHAVFLRNNEGQLMNNNALCTVVACRRQKMRCEGELTGRH